MKFNIVNFVKYQISVKYYVRYKLGNQTRARYFRSFRAMKRFVRVNQLYKTKFFLRIDKLWHRFIVIGDMKVTRFMYTTMGKDLMSDNYDTNLFS